MDYPSLDQNDYPVNRSEEPMTRYPELSKSKSVQPSTDSRTKKPSVLRINWHLRGLLTSVAIWAAIIVPFTLDIMSRLRIVHLHFDLVEFWNKFWVVFVALYLVYIIESLSSPIIPSLYNMLSAQDMVAYILDLKKQKPAIKFKAESFHFELAGSLASNEGIQTTDQSKKENPSSQVLAQKVISHKFEENYEYTTCYDDSGMINNDINFFKIIKIKLTKQFEMGSQDAQADLDVKLSEFVFRLQNKDAHLSHEVVMQIQGFKSHILCNKDEKSSRFIGLKTYFLVTTFLLLSWPYRVYIELISFEKNFCIKKLIYDK
jgi:hypothetical protein